MRCAFQWNELQHQLRLKIFNPWRSFAKITRSNAENSVRELDSCWIAGWCRVLSPSVVWRAGSHTQCNCARPQLWSPRHDAVAVSKLFEIAKQRWMHRAVEFVIASDERAWFFSSRSDSTPALLQGIPVGKLSGGHFQRRKGPWQCFTAAFATSNFSS